jgi:hypothetical protein
MSESLIFVIIVIIAIFVIFYTNSGDKPTREHRFDTRPDTLGALSFVELSDRAAPSSNWSTVAAPSMVSFQTQLQPRCTERAGLDCLQTPMYSEEPMYEDVEFLKYKNFREQQKYNEFMGIPCTPSPRDVDYSIVSPNLTPCTLYSTADVDPLITGQLYAHSNQRRNVYAQRTSMGDERGMHEYNSSGEPGDVGVDIGPYGLYEYEGRRSGYDDGIPENWAFPSTPIRWYEPYKQDYYGKEGPTVYSEGLFNLREPDHIPKMP